LADEFRIFAQKCEEISLTKSKNKKVNILAEYLSELTYVALPIVVLFFSGRIFPPDSRLLVKVAHSTIMNVLSSISDLKMREVNRIYLEHGDLGYLAEYSLSQKFTIPLIDHSQLTLASVYDSLTKIAGVSGQHSQTTKKKILAGLFIRCVPSEGKYLSKILTDELRIGLSEGLLVSAISKAFGVKLDTIRNALLVTGNISQISLLAKKNILDTAKMQPLTPISFMLSDVMYNPNEIVNYFSRDLIAEYKYDGIRAQVHINGNEVKVFSRNLNDVSSFFPELVQGALDNFKKGRMIFDGEILASKNEKVLPFQYLQRRLNAKNISPDGIGSVPVIYTIFDALYIDGELINKPLIKRKKILNEMKIFPPFTLAKWRLVHSERRISELFNESKNLGYEGLILKDPQSEYQIGKRGRKWIKLKKELDDTLDVVIVMAEYGHGKRAGMLSDYTFAIKKSVDEDELVTIGKAYSGLSDREISVLTSELGSIALRKDGYRIWVEPKIVLEVSFDSIQKSKRHQSGYALRFPRIKMIRRDKSVRDIDALSKVIEICSRQKHEYR
jgi:DNA ligase 1